LSIRSAGTIATLLPDTADGNFWESTRGAIDPRIDELARIQPRPNRILRVSVFVLAPIPLLFYLGSRQAGDRSVPAAPTTGDLELARRTRGAIYNPATQAGGGEIALLVNVSGSNSAEAVVGTLGECVIYELTIDGQPAIRHTPRGGEEIGVRMGCACEQARNACARTRLRQSMS
jgi:hypothetical protein